MSKKRIAAYVELENIKRNIEEIRKRLPSGVKCCAVIKADAYGHGADMVAHSLTKEVDFFAVATAEEALRLRERAISNPLLILGYVWPQDLEELIEAQIRVPIFTMQDARRISDFASRRGKKAYVHIKVDTGMNRIGFPMTEAAVNDVRAIRKLEGLVVEGIFTHFARADEADKTYTYKQYNDFRKFIADVEDGEDPIPIHHCCNSAAALDLPEMAMDMVRLGIAMYGMYPSDDISREIKLLPAISLKSHIVYIKDVAKGEGISYNHVVVLDSDRRIATVPVGYADGYPRLLTGKAQVLVRGKRVPIIGRICMDQLMIDVTDLPEAQFGDVVTLIGRDGDEEITVNELADLCGRFHYEFVCELGPRVPRIYNN